MSRWSAYHDLAAAVLDQALRDVRSENIEIANDAYRWFTYARPWNNENPYADSRIVCELLGIEHGAIPFTARPTHQLNRRRLRRPIKPSHR